MNKKRKLNKFGKLPINARITIDYSKKKPKITFGYIAAKQQRSLNYMNIFSMIPTIIIISLGLWLCTNYTHSWETAPLIGICGFYEQHSLGNNTVSAYNITCGEKSYLVKYKQGKGFSIFGTAEGFSTDKTTASQVSSWNFIDTTGKPWYIIFFVGILILLFAFGAMFGTMALIFGMSYFFGWSFQYIPYINKKVNRWIPEVNKKMTSARYSAIFKKCPEDKVIEIPLFHNVFLDYDTQGEFSKYLQRVEIREHPFAMLAKKSVFGRRQKQKYKKKKNIFLWKAIFIFKEVPKRGQLEVRWA
jgi:hypothetical protein